MVLIDNSRPLTRSQQLFVEQNLGIVEEVARSHSLRRRDSRTSYEDCVQQAAIGVMRASRKKFDASRSLRGFVYGHARGGILSESNSENRNERYARERGVKFQVCVISALQQKDVADELTIESIVDREYELIDSTDRRERAARLHAAIIEVCTERERWMLHALYWSDLRIDQVASLLGVDTSTAQFWLTTVLDRLREQLTQYGGFE